MHLLHGYIFAPSLYQSKEKEIVSGSRASNLPFASRFIQALLWHMCSADCSAWPQGSTEDDKESTGGQNQANTCSSTGTGERGHLLQQHCHSRKQSLLFHHSAHSPRTHFRAHTVKSKNAHLSHLFKSRGLKAMQNTSMSLIRLSSKNWEHNTSRTNSFPAYLKLRGTGKAELCMKPWAFPAASLVFKKHQASY